MRGRGWSGGSGWTAWLFNRHVGVVLLWALLTMAVAAFVNVAGVHALGGVEGWERWLRAHAGHFFVWRLGLYAATAYGWRRMRQRLRQDEPDAEARRRLWRAEIAAVIALVALEASQLQRWN